MHFAAQQGAVSSIQADICDVKSGFEATALDGTKYADW